MHWLKVLLLFAGIAAVPVIRLARAAASLVWSAPLTWGRALVMVLLVGGTFFALAMIAKRVFATHERAALASVGWFALAFVNVGQLRPALFVIGVTEIWHWLLVVAVGAALAIWIGTRFDSKMIALTSFVPVLVLVQTVLMITDLQRVDEPPPVAAPAVEASVGTPPSVWVIVLDAHASPRALRDFHGVDLSAPVANLEEAGFRVWDDARTSYSHTLVSVPSLLSGDVWEPETVSDQFDAMLAGLHGGTSLLAAMREEGFSIRMVPANWSRSACGDLVDECFGEQRYDEHWHFFFRTTPLPDLIPSVLAHPWPLGGLTSLEVIATIEDTAQHVTFVHSLATHPPTVVGEDCSGTQEQNGRLADQLRCSHETLSASLESIDLSSDVVIVTSDHGLPLSDLSDPPELWSDAVTRARFSAFAAISTPDGCEDSLAEQLTTAQILPLILNCYGGELPVPEPVFLKVEHKAFGGVGATKLDWDGWSVYAP